MRIGFALLLVAVLATTTLSWELECRTKILDDFITKLEFLNVTQATDDLTNSAKTAVFSEIYDTYLNYNSDFNDRVDEDATGQVFKDAESKLDYPSSKVELPDATIFETNATVKFYLTGACCYYFNPCIALTIGYHAQYTVKADDEPVAVSQSFAKQWMSPLLEVIKAKAKVMPAQVATKTE